MITSDQIELLKNTLEDLKSEGKYRYFNYLQRNISSYPIIEINSKKVINFCGNDYLGMSINQRVIDKCMQVIQESGIGTGGTRNISGSTVYHLELERLVATMHKKEAGLIFNSAYMANLATLSTFTKLFPDCVMISDEMNHASIINGIRSNNAQKFIYKHNDVQHLEKILKQIPYNQTKLIIFESVYSISGIVAPISEICSLAKKYNAMTYVDEVHAVGIYGKNGFGMIEKYGLEGEVDIINGTFSKAFGTVGGYISSKSEIIDCIRSLASGFIFTTSIPSCICAATIESISVVKNSPEIREKLFKNVESLKLTLKKYNIPITENDTHIIQIVIGNAKKCKELSDLMLGRGFYTQSINYPTVPVNNECFRATVSPLHTIEQIESFVKSLLF